MSAPTYESHQLTAWTRRRIESITDVEAALWVAVVATLLGDVWLTQMGLQQGLREGNPFVRTLIGSYGIGALPVLKLSVVAIGGAAASYLPDSHAFVVPLGLAIPWAGAVVVNGTLLLG